MRDHTGWSVGLGRWGDVQLRLHMFFLLFVVCTLYLSWLAGQSTGQAPLLWAGILSICLLLTSVALHVVAHVYASTRLAVKFSSIVVGPFGELGPQDESGSPLSRILVALAGPGMNLLLAVVCAVPIFLAGENLLRLIYPLSPVGLTEGPTWLVTLKLAVWINWGLLLVNLLPAVPFDGGRVARAAVQAARPGIGHRRTARIVARIAKVAALLLVLVAWLMRSAEPAQLVPAWFALLLLAVVLFFSAQREEHRRWTPPREEDDGLFGYDFSQGYTSLQRSEQRLHHDGEGEMEEDNSPLERWLDGRRAARRQRQEEIEAEEDALVDEILARVHQSGVNCLTPEERSLLERASARYRSRDS